MKCWEDTTHKNITHNNRHLTFHWNKHNLCTWVSAQKLKAINFLFFLTIIKSWDLLCTSTNTLFSISITKDHNILSNAILFFYQISLMLWSSHEELSQNPNILHQPKQILNFLHNKSLQEKKNRTKWEAIHATRPSISSPSTTVKPNSHIESRPNFLLFPQKGRKRKHKQRQLLYGAYLHAHQTRRDRTQNISK